MNMGMPYGDVFLEIRLIYFSLCQSVILSIIGQRQLCCSTKRKCASSLGNGLMGVLCTPWKDCGGKKFFPQAITENTCNVKY